jgi:uncharacterized protein
MIVDCHIHLNNYHLAQPSEAAGPAEDHLQRLREQMDKHGLDQCVVLTSYTVNPDRPSAARVLELLRGEPRLHVVEGLGVTGPAPMDWEGVEGRLRAGRTRGLKIYPGYEHAYPTDARFQPAYGLAAKYRVPVMVHTGDTYAPQGKLKFAHPLQVDEVAVDHPDVDFVVCHLGNPWFRDTAELLYKNENVYADISGLVLEEFTAPMEAYMREELQDLLLYSGEPDKILYGTDWPLVRMGPYLRFVEQLALTPEHRAMLLGENAVRLFRLPPLPQRPDASPQSDPEAAAAG